MSNQALAFRNNAQAQWSGATVAARGRNWIKHAHPSEPNRYMLDVCIGPIHTALQTEIDTAWQADSGVWQWQMTSADFQARSKSAFNGAPLAEYRDGAEWVTLQPRQLDWHNDRGDVQSAGGVQAVTATVNDDVLRWTNAYGAGRHFEYQAQTARLAKKIILDSYASLPAPSAQILSGGNPVLRAQFQFAWSTGLSVYVDGVQWTGGGGAPTLTTANAIEFRLANGTVLFAFQKPHTVPADGDEAPGVVLRVSRAGANILVETRTPQAWLASATYPVIIDPTIDKTVAASANDADEDGTGAVTLARFPCLTIDATNEWFAARWDISDAPIPTAATITACTITCQFTNSTNDEPNHPMYFQEVANPGVFAANANDISGRARTTASVTWSSTNLGGAGDFATPDLATPLQEVVDSQGQLSAIVWIINGSADSARDFAVQTYDGSTTLAPRLHVEYTSSSAITGALSQTLGSMTTTTAGTVAVTGTFAKTLGITATSATQVTITASLEKTLGVLLVASAGSVSVTSAANVILGNLLSSGASQVDVSGALGSTLGALDTTTSGQVDVSGLLGLTLASLTSSTAGSVDVTGSLIKTLGALVSAASGDVYVTGSLLQTLGALVLSASGVASNANEILGSLAATLGNVTIVSTGSVDVSGIIGSVFASATSSGSGSVAISSELSKTLGALSLDADASVTVTGTLAQVLAALLLVSAGSFPTTEYSQGGLVSVKLRRNYSATGDDVYTAELRRNYKA